MNDANAIRAIAERFFAAVEAGDVGTVRDSYTPNAVIWHGHTRQNQDRDTNVATLERFISLSRERRYADRKLRLFPGGFVQQHILIAVSNGGAVLELPAALVCEVEDGRISRLEEYFDNSVVIAWSLAADFAGQEQ